MRMKGDEFGRSSFRCLFFYFSQILPKISPWQQIFINVFPSFVLFLILILAFTSYLHKVKTFFVLEVLILCRRNLHTGEKPNFFCLQVNRLKSCKITHFNFRPSAVANEETCLGRSCAKKRKDVLMGCVLVGIRSCLPGGQFVSGDTHYRHHSVHCLLPCF